MADEVLINMIKSLSLDSGVVTSIAERGTDMLADNTKSWIIDDLRGCIVKIIKGSGTGQLAIIKGNRANSLQVSPAWIIGLDTTSVYIICKPEVNSEIVAILALLQDSVFGLNALENLLIGTRIVGRTQIFEQPITAAANAGDVIVATITTQPCQIESVIIHANSAQTANMTSCGVFGGVGKVITFISAADAIQANLNAADKQVAWTGAVRLATGKTIVISLVGTGATTVDLTIVIKYRACVKEGHLA